MQFLEFAVHDNAAAGLLNFSRGCFPHHAGATAIKVLALAPPWGVNPKERLKPSASALARLSPLIR
jgi:hypothetical protein